MREVTVVMNGTREAIKVNGNSAKVWPDGNLEIFQQHRDDSMISVFVAASGCWQYYLVGDDVVAENSPA